MESLGRPISAHFHCQFFYFLKSYPNNGNDKNNLEKDLKNMVDEEGALSAAPGFVRLI